MGIDHKMIRKDYMQKMNKAELAEEMVDMV